MSAILDYAKHPEFEEFRAEATDLFNDDRLEHLSAEDRRRLKDVDWNLKFAFCLLFDLPFGRAGTTLCQRFLLSQDGGKLPAGERELLERFSTSSLRPYEVQEIQIDSSIRLRDLWFEREVSVSERMATHQVHQWDILAARVVPEGERNVFEGALYPYRAEGKALLMGALKQERTHIHRSAPEIDDALFLKRCSPFFHQFWLDHVVFPPRPKIVTAEGDFLIFGEVVFDVLDLPNLEAVLDAHPELRAQGDRRWTWVDLAPGVQRSLGNLGVDRDRLRLETTSRERAERGRRLLETAAGPALRHCATSFESIEQARKRPRPAAPREPSVPDVGRGPDPAGLQGQPLSDLAGHPAPRPRRPHAAPSGAPQDAAPDADRPAEGDGEQRGPWRRSGQSGLRLRLDVGGVGSEAALRRLRVPEMK